MQAFEHEDKQSAVVKGQAAVHRCSDEVEFFGKEHHTFMGSEDFAFYLDKLPGFMLFLGARNEKIGVIHAPHSPHYILDEDVLPIGAAIHAAFAHSFLSDSIGKLHLHNL
ncbi:IAA-amino acid hydrolase ILR1-like 6 [Pyrus x bretschneideri]|uniref:IAA-amino acid hydrolase ILR1-like 6 n=1 Tax=Pyrus x bretschneideri TaxID=225117 RepID=UPI00202F33A4|nr:IAA-amino acid hydrolase ILR1-like 6 [Pyrus x bretschneideri]